MFYKISQISILLESCIPDFGCILQVSPIEIPWSRTFCTASPQLKVTDTQVLVVVIVYRLPIEGMVTITHNYTSSSRHTEEQEPGYLPTVLCYHIILFSESKHDLI